MVAKGNDATFSWGITHFEWQTPGVTSLSVYNGAKDKANKLWTGTDGIQPKAHELFNGRLKVDYFKIKRDPGPPGPISKDISVSGGVLPDDHYVMKVAVTIQNVNVNDAITITLSYSPYSETIYESSVTLDVQGIFIIISHNYRTIETAFFWSSVCGRMQAILRIKAKLNLIFNSDFQLELLKSPA